jgi:hypothetical protein
VPAEGPLHAVGLLECEGEGKVKPVRYVVAKTFWDRKGRDRDAVLDMLGRYAQRYKRLCPYIELASENDASVGELGMRGFYMVAWGFRES